MTLSFISGKPPTSLPCHPPLPSWASHGLSAHFPPQLPQRLSAYTCFHVCFSRRAPTSHQTLHAKTLACSSSLGAGQWVLAQRNLRPQVAFCNLHSGFTPPWLLCSRWSSESLVCPRSVEHHFLCFFGEPVFSTTKLTASLELSHHYFLNSSAFPEKARYFL